MIADPVTLKLLSALEHLLAAARCGYDPKVALSEYGAEADEAIRAARADRPLAAELLSACEKLVAWDCGRGDDLLSEACGAARVAICKVPGCDVPTADQFYTVHQAGESLRAAGRTVAKWVHSGRLCAVAGTDQQTWRLSRSELIRFAAEHGLLFSS